MTLVSLKRHIDRRFAEVHRRFATKDDLRRFATKKDLRRFATKKDLKRFATRDDLARLEARMDTRFGEMLRRFDSFEAKMVSRLTFVGDSVKEHRTVLDEHEERLQDLEGRDAH